MTDANYSYKPTGPDKDERDRKVRQDIAEVAEKLRRDGDTVELTDAALRVLMSMEQKNPRPRKEVMWKFGEHNGFDEWYENRVEAGQVPRPVQWLVKKTYQKAMGWFEWGPAYGWWIKARAIHGVLRRDHTSEDLGFLFLDRFFELSTKQAEARGKYESLIFYSHRMKSILERLDGLPKDITGEPAALVRAYRMEIERLASEFAQYAAGVTMASGMVWKSYWEKDGRFFYWPEWDR